MTRKYTFLMTAMVLILAIMGPRSVAWGQTDYSGTFTRITSADDFATGYYVVTGAGTTKALGNTANSNKRIEGVNVTINENSITNPSNSVVYYITRTENTCTFQNVGNSKYMYQAATTSGKGMGFRDNSANITFEGWTSGGTGTSAYEGFAFTLNGTSNNKLKYNKNSAWFANYDNDYSNTMLPVDLYKLATNSPTCTIDPTSHDFGEIAVGGSATFDFTVTTANLTEDLTLAVSEDFSVSPATINSTETETTVTITCAPTAVGAFDGTLTISGGGLTDDVTATLTATGLCTAPTTALSYTTPVGLQLTAGEAEATLAPIANTGNGGTITYELIAGDESHLLLNESTGEIYTDAIGSYTVRATQAVNGTICGGTFDIVINVTSTSPSCSVSPSEWDFGNVAIGTPASKTFTVTTANLTGDLTVSLSMDETTYSVTPTTIPQSATSTDVNVTFTPVEDGLIEELLTISGGGLTSDVEVELTATGISPYTVTYVAASGDAPQAAIVEQGSSITLGTVENVDCNTWQFAGWSESENSTEAPTLLAGAEYTPIGNVTLYAVYKKGTGSSGSFEYVFEGQGFSNAQEVFNDEMDATSGIGWSATTGGSNTPKYYDLGTGLRVYNGGSFSVTTNGNTITNVTLTFSDDGYTFSSSTPNPTTWSGSQSTDISWSVSRTCRLQKVNVTYSNLSYTYSTDPDCSTPVATPTITPNGGEFIGSQEITLACTTEGATIFYTTDNWETSNTYSAPFTITATTTLKVKATKEGMSESEIAEATYTKRYKVDYVVNGDATAIASVYVTQGEVLGTLPTATAPNGYTFKGWNAGDVALTNDEPTYVTAETAPTGDMTLKAVFAMAGTVESTEDMTYSLLPSNFATGGYNANNGDKEINGITLTINDVYQNSSSIQMKASSGTLNNKFALGQKITSVVVNVKTNSVNVYEGSANNSWTEVTGSNGTYTFSDGKAYFKVTSTSNYAQVYSIDVNYVGTTSSTVYSNYCTSVSSPEIPAEISGNVTIPSGAAYTLTSSITIKSGATLTVNGALGNTNASLLVIEDGGQLICGNEVSATVRKSISGYTVPSGEGANGWYIVSAPITDATASMAATGTYDLYTHDEAHYMWRNYEVAANQTTYDWFNSGYGYLYANAANTTLQFAGTVAAEGQKEVNLTCAANDATHGWNLLGNHTTHNIFFTGNNIEDGYYVMNAAGNAYESRLTSVPVAPCEGFFVKATSNTTVTLNPQPVSKSEEETPAIIETRVTETANANYSDVAYIVKGYGNNLTKISFGETTPSLFFAENGKDYAITHISDETEVLPLYFKASANANYTLNFNIDGEEFDYVVLNDMKTGAQIDLLENSSYSFDATTEDDENRFNIVFVASATEAITENMDQPFAYRSGNEFIISSNGTLQIIDALGRVISTQAISGSARVNVGNLTQGTYIMRLIGDNTVRTQKIVVK